jgi:hypothetical protein
MGPVHFYLLRAHISTPPVSSMNARDDESCKRFARQTRIVLGLGALEARRGFGNHKAIRLESFIMSSGFEVIGINDFDILLTDISGGTIRNLEVDPLSRGTCRKYKLMTTTRSLL